MSMGDEQRIPLLVVGSGGHAKVVIDAAQASGRYDVVGVLAEQPEALGGDVLGVPVVRGSEALDRPEYRTCAVVVAIGDNEARERVAKQLEEAGRVFATIIHPSAQLAADVVFGEGTVIFAGAVANPGTRIGRHVIVNTCASVDHDGRIEDFAHISPGAALAGGVRIGPGAHVGIGASVIQNVTIGAWSIVGAGAAVIDDLPDGVVAAGVPARVIRG